jgi:hypothetical protein
MEAYLARKKPQAKQCLKCRRWMLSDIGNRICEECETLNKTVTDIDNPIKVIHTKGGNHEGS